MSGGSVMIHEEREDSPVIVLLYMDDSCVLGHRRDIDELFKVVRSRFTFKVEVG